MADGQDKIKVFELDTKAATTSIKELRLLLKAYKDEMAGLEEGSDEFLAVANAAGLLKHLIDEISQSINGASADFGDMLSSGSKAIQGIMGGFLAAQGALTLFGVESEEVTKAIQKMQASMAVIQGLDAIDNGIKGLAKFRNAITSTTTAAKLLKAALQPKIFLAVTAGVTALTAGIKKLFENSQKLHDAEVQRYEAYKQSQLDKRLEEERKISTALNEQYALNEKIYKIRFGGNDVKVYTALLADYRKELDGVNAALKNQYNDEEKLAAKSKLRTLEELLKGLAEGSSEYMAKLIEITHQEAVVNSIRPKSAEELEKLTKRQAELNEKIEQSNNSLREAQIIERELNAAEQANTKTKKDAKAVKDTFITDAYAEIEYNKALNEEYANSKTSLEDLLSIQEMELATLDEGSAAWYRLATAIEKTKQEIANFGKAEEGADENTITLEKLPTLGEQIATSLEAAQYAISTLGADSNWGTVIGNIQSIAANWDKTIKDIQKGGKDAGKAITQLGASVTAGLGSMFTALANEQDTSTKEGFEQSKKLQIAATVMNTISGVMAAWTSSLALPAPASFILGGIQTAFTAALGAAQIAKIQQQQFEGGNTSSATASPSASAVNATIVAPSDYSTAVQGAELETKIGDTKVYVTETDIAKTTNKVLVQETENRY